MEYDSFYKYSSVKPLKSPNQRPDYCKFGEKIQIKSITQAINKMRSKKNPSQRSKTKFWGIEISKNGDVNSNRKSIGRNFGMQKRYLKKENNNVMLTLGICIEETKHNEKCK